MSKLTLLLVPAPDLQHLRVMVKPVAFIPGLVQRIVGLSRPLAEHWIMISLSSSRHCEVWGVGVNFSLSETQVKTPYTHYTCGGMGAGQSLFCAVRLADEMTLSWCESCSQVYGEMWLHANTKNWWRLRSIRGWDLTHRAWLDNIMSGCLAQFNATDRNLPWR